MKLDRVTITGADDSCLPSDLLAISWQYDFVEWGILVSSSRGKHGSPRFPSHQWIKDFQTLATGASMRLSLHVCGQWVRELLKGNVLLPEWMLDGFQRVQLNFHAERTDCDPPALFKALRSLGDRQFIFQVGAKGNAHLESIYAENDHHVVDAVPLFDVSGGAGIVPTEWPEPMYMETDVDHVYHGYAGGLGPDTLDRELPRIKSAAERARIWIDMETRIRSDNDKKFDLAKVRRCLEICAPHVRNMIAV